MSIDKYIPQKGEQVLVTNDLLNMINQTSHARIFSHIDDDKFVCYNNISNLTDNLSNYTTHWNHCKRLNGLFHKDFQPEIKPLKLYL